MWLYIIFVPDCILILMRYFTKKVNCDRYGRPSSKKSTQLSKTLGSIAAVFSSVQTYSFISPSDILLELSFLQIFGDYFMYINCYFTQSAGVVKYTD